MGFSVTYAIYAPDTEGDPEESGYINESCGLREAIRDVYETRTAHCGGALSVEANDSDAAQARWVSVSNGMEYHTGMSEVRALHIPETVTPASRARIVRAALAF